MITVILGTVALSIGVQQFGCVPNDAAMLLLDTREEVWDVNEGDQRDVEGVTEPDPAGALHGGVDVKHSRGVVGLVGDEGYGAAVHAAEAHHHVRGKVRHDLKELFVVNNLVNHILDVVGLGGVMGHKSVQGRDHTGPVTAQGARSRMDWERKG